MDLRRSPVGILLRHAPDQLTNLLRDLRPAARPWAPTPVESEPSAANSGSRLVQKSLSKPVQSGPRPFALKHRDLLSEGEDLKRGITPPANVVFRGPGQGVASC
jgi:hypothetical protein